MSTTEVCVLDNGVRVKYRVDWRKPRSSYLYVYFKGADGKRKEFSTNETTQRRAKDAAVVLIHQEYQPEKFLQSLAWDEAIEKMVNAMKGQNLRPNSIRAYCSVLKTLRDVFPSVIGPNGITKKMGQEYKARRIEKGRSPHTVKGDLNELKIVFGHWLKDECGLVVENPFAETAPPKVDKLEPRLVSSAQRESFENWLSEQWGAWRLPLLFLDVKAAIGCRITELASTPTMQLLEGRITFEAVLAKGRKTRRSKLPVTLYHEMVSIAGPTFVFERYADELRERLLAKGRLNHARLVKPGYKPERFVSWLQHQLIAYRDTHENEPYFKLHNYRGTAMSQVRQAGIGYAEAAIAFGCNPETMRKHYESLDELTISDGVMDVLHGISHPKSVED